MKYSVRNEDTCLFRTHAYLPTYMYLHLMYKNIKSTIKQTDIIPKPHAHTYSYIYNKAIVLQPILFLESCV